MAEGKGVYSLFQSDVDLLVLFLGFTISSAIVFYVSNNRIKIEKLFGIGIIFVLGGAVILSLSYFLIPLFFSENFLFPKGYESKFYHFYLLASFCVVMSTSILSSIFQGKSKFKVVNFISLFNSVLNFLTYALIFYLSEFKQYKIDVDFILTVSIIIYLINIFVWAYFFKRQINIMPSFSFDFKAEIKPLFVFITIGHIAHMVNFLTYKMDFWIVQHYNGAKELGYYSQAVGFSQMFWSITNPIIVVLTPYLTSKNNNEGLEAFKFFSRINFTIILILVLIAFFLSGFIFPLYGKEFEFSVLPFRILSISIIMSCITKIFAVYIYAQNKIIYNLIAASVAFVVTAICDFSLIPKYGMIGASIATAISYTTLTVMVSYFLFFKLKVTPNNLLLVTKSDYQNILQKVKSIFFQA